MTPDDRLADLLERWENAESNGERPTPEDICKETPDDLPAFRALLRQLGLAGMMIADDKKTADARPAGFRAGRYTATEFHAAGGLGLVFRARDAELNRNVALKCMRTSTSADTPTGRRFLQEAEITSQLEHPGIAPVHGRGKTDDGRPFYTMRFIEGETLQDATRRFHAPSGASSRERNIELRRLLRAFVGVCETVAYAHSRGVIHRDLKPSNVMVGPFGEVLVMDWGLAKSQESDVSDLPQTSRNSPPTYRGTPVNDLTVHGHAKGSPSFMSPEQARGEWDKVGPTSDVYSLGSTLYYLLTGKTPYDGRSSAEVVAKVREGMFTPPRSLSHDVDAALDAVCRKAMAFAPGERYASAKELADDVERWLADEPVSAWREPLPVRIRRWARRNQTLVTSTAAACAVGVILLAVYGYRLDRKNEDLRLSNERETAARKKAEDRKKLADERFQLALGSSAVMVTDIQTKLIRSPGTRSLRESLLKDAIARLEELIRKADETREVNRTTLWARLRLGDLYRDVEQNPTNAEIEYGRALGLARSLLEEHPRHPLVSIDAIEALQRLGRVQVQLGRYGKAAGFYEEAGKLIEEAASLADEQHAKNLSLQAELALEIGEAPRAFDLFTQARDIRQKHADPTNDDSIFALAEVMLIQGEAALRSGRHTDALDYYVAAGTKWIELQKRRPTDVTVQRKAALLYHGLAQVHTQLGRPEGRQSSLWAFFDITQKLAEDDPLNGETQLELALAYNAIAIDAIHRFDLPAVQENAQKSLEIINRLARIDPKNLNNRRNHAIALSKLADLGRKRQKPLEALWRFGEAIAICRDILKVAPDRTATIADLAEWLKDLGRIELFQSANKQKGQATLTESIDHWNKLIEIDSSNLNWQVRRLEAHQVLAGWHKSQRKLDDADAVLRAGLAPTDRLSKEDLDTANVRRAMGILRVELAGLDFERMKKDETIASVEREIETLNRDAKERPKASFVWELLDRNHTLLAELYAKKRNAAESVKHRDNAIDACKRGLELDHLSGVFRRNLQLHLAHQAEQKMASDPEAALKLLKLALDHSPRFPPDLAETSILHASFAALDARAGDCYERLNNPREAYSHYFDALEHHQKVAEIEPNAPGIPGVLAYDHRRMAELQLYYLDFKGAAFNYLAAKKILDQMRADKKSLRLLDQQTDKLVKDFLPFAQSLPEGIETLDAAAKQPEAVRFVALRVRVAWLIHAGKMDEAAATAERITAEKSANGDAYAQAAVEFARLTAKDKSNADKYATRTIELLQKAKESGYFRGADDVAWLDWETLFTPIRKDDRFQALVKEVRAKEKN